jgi:tetratricopeptide (TPR) repeat protein
MRSPLSVAGMRRSFVLGALVVAVASGGCKKRSVTLPPARETFAELRAIKGTLAVTAPGEKSRAPYPRERLIDGQHVAVPAGGLAWLRRDGGATWLVSGPAKLIARAGSIELTEGRAFVDGEAGEAVAIVTPRGKIELSDARASLNVTADGSVQVYVLRGSARAVDGERARAGEELTLRVNAKPVRAPVVSFEDWTGGLATADPAADPAPFGIGTVGARKAGDSGKPRFPLVVERLDVRVTIDRDFALTEVDETFANPSSDVVEGIFSFRTPPSAILHRFGVDRNGDLVWGRVQESASATRQYESNVYAGSTEDPALLKWGGPGVYHARLYPIQGGASRRVVTRYGEWLPRQGPNGERRLYVYPMAAEGARGSLPRIEELNISIDVSRAAARSVRAGMNGKREGDKISVQAFDFVPRADLAVELFDGGQDTAVVYRAPHALGAEDMPRGADRDFGRNVSREEADYVAVPLRVFGGAAVPDTGLDLAVVVDTSAATDPGALAIARSMASSLLAHLGPADRAALFAGDATLWPAAAGSGELTTLDREKKKSWLAGLASVERGGASDLGALLTTAASRLDPKRRGAVVYIGDGQPSVGESAPKSLRERLARLPPTVRVLAAGVGSDPNVALLQGLVRGAPVERVADAYGAARAALRLLEAASKPVWLGTSVDLGPGIERVLPRELPPLAGDDSVLVVGRLAGKMPENLTLRGSGGVVTRRVSVRTLADGGDLRRRWGEGRLAELLAEGAGRSAVVDAGRRFGLVSPVTSLYVPTTREDANEPEEGEQLAGMMSHLKKVKRWKPWLATPSAEELASKSGGAQLHFPVLGARSSPMMLSYDAKEGGTGTRAKGEEAATAGGSKRYAAEEDKAADGSSAPGAVAAAAPPAPMPVPTTAAAPLQEQDLAAEKTAAKPMVSEPSDEHLRPNAWGQLSGLGRGGGGVGLSGIGTPGSGASESPPQRFGAGQGRLGGSHAAPAPRVRIGSVDVSGPLPQDVVGRIVRQSFGRFRVCYEQGLLRNPALAGTVAVRFVIARDGSVTGARNDASDLADPETVACVLVSFAGLSFPEPEGAVVTVRYSVNFEPPAAASAVIGTSKPPPRTPGLGFVGHEPKPCGKAADLPLSERTLLWQERLAPFDAATHALVVYQDALANCEASRWDERSLLLVLMVDRLKTVSSRVSLYRLLLDLSPAAADAVYRFLALRVQTSAELKELHQALGLTRVEPTLLADLLKKARTPAEKVTLLRGAAQRFEDDTELALLVLDAYEDAGDYAGGRAWARRLRRRVDATAHARTSVGEFYLRLSERETGAERARDAEEARRTFGELVEFAPEDPLARRHLGDLLRAHGWYDQALRQYETLAELTPDDASVPLLRAAAAQGLGRVEEAVRWAEKAAAVSSPDHASQLSLAARALASSFLAWAREDANKAGRKEEAVRLRARAARLSAAGSINAGNVRFVLSWSHPELRPALWTRALGSPMPAVDNLPLYGVAEAYLAASPAPVVEVRLDAEDAARAARLGARAVLTAIVNEGADDERIARLDLGFRDAAGKPLEISAVRFENGALTPAEAL